MLKSGSAFKLSKDAKRMLARFTDPHKRGVMKKGIIQAELAALQQPRREKKNNQNTDLE